MIEGQESFQARGTADAKRLKAVNWSVSEFTERDPEGIPSEKKPKSARSCPLCRCCWLPFLMLVTSFLLSYRYSCFHLGIWLPRIKSTFSHLPCGLVWPCYQILTQEVLGEVLCFSFLETSFYTFGVGLLPLLVGPCLHLVSWNLSTVAGGLAVILVDRGPHWGGRNSMLEG